MTLPAGHALTDDEVDTIIAKAGTPVFAYRAETMAHRANECIAAFSGHLPFRLYFALKANNSLAIANHFRLLGLGLDASSLGEIDLARAAGYDEQDISVSGFGLTAEEIYKIAQGDSDFIADSVSQIHSFGAAAPKKKSFGIRVNPGIEVAGRDVCVGTGSASKFGISLEKLSDAVAAAQSHGLIVDGLHFHVGSGFTEPSPYQRALEHLLPAVANLLPLRYINIGGGLLNPSHPAQSEFDMRSFAESIADTIRRFCPTNVPQLRMELGEYLVAEAGNLICRVIAVKEVPGNDETRWFAGVDTSTEHLGRRLGQRYIPLRIKQEAYTTVKQLYSLVGNTNQSVDVIAEQVSLPKLSEQDVVILEQVGAYRMIRATHFGGRVPPAEVWLEFGKLNVIRPRQEASTIFSHQFLSNT